MKIVKKGDKVKIEYVGKLEDGTVFDSTENHGQPLEFEAGAGMLLAAFEENVIGMGEGEEKKITLSPGEAYGDYNPELVRDLPKNCFPQDQKIEAGMVFLMKLQNGKQYPVRIVEVEDEKIKVDLNPPLAGKTLIFEIKVLQIAS